MERMYTVKEVAEIIGISEGTVRNYLSSGKMAHVKVLGNTRVVESELKKHIVPVSKEESR